MLLCLLAGASLGALLFLCEALIATTVDATWSALLATPLIAWSAGVGAGVVAGVLFARGRSDRSPLRILLSLLAGILLVQINHRFLPDALEPGSLLITALLIAFFVLAERLLRATALARALGRLFATGGKTPSVLLAITLAMAVGLTLAAPRPVIYPGVWRPTPQPLPVVDSAAASGSRALLMIGIDGGRWETIDPLLRAGRMPNLASLVARGRRGVLASIVRSASPVVWTTIMTGQPPEVHGITDWDVAISTNRRVLPLWSILGELGQTSYAVNVPGSFPADRFNGGMLAGFPMPQGSRSNRGWLVTTAADIDPHGPMAVAIAPLSTQPRPVSLIDLPSPFALEKTTPYLLLRRVNESIALELARHLSGRSYATFDLSLRQADGCMRLQASAAGHPLFDLAAGEWGPWLSLEADGLPCIMRPYAARVDAEETSLFFTALFREDGPGLSAPPGLAGALQSEGHPYVAEGTGWQIFYEARVLSALEDHQMQIAADRKLASLQLMRRTPWDAFIHIFTLTDRAQHPFWKYREPELYQSIPDRYPEYANPEDYQRFAPTSDEIRRFGGAIDRAYEAVDAWLGEVLDNATDSTFVVVVSDHGGQGGPHELSPTAGIHHENGIYLIAGPTVLPRAVDAPPFDAELQQIDIVPLLLAHLGLPAARDLPGRIPEALLPYQADGTPRPLPEPVATFETDSAHRGDVGEIDDAIRDQLRSLGYVK
jgi:hypothetical protein